MRDNNGAVRDRSLVHNPMLARAYQQSRLLRGVIMENGVEHFQPGNLVLVNVRLEKIRENLFHLPILSPKINSSNGFYQDPEPGDHVVIGFFDLDGEDPVVLGFIPPPRNELQTKSATDAPRSFRRMNGTSEEITKTGRRIVHVAENEEVEIVGSGSVTIGNGITINVTGNAEITVSGHTSLLSEGGVDIDGGSGDLSGIVTKDCRCAFTGRPHSDYSENVNGSKG